jgi:hypothetical protein
MPVSSRPQIRSSDQSPTSRPNNRRFAFIAANMAVTCGRENSPTLLGEKPHAPCRLYIQPRRFLSKIALARTCGG